MAKQKTDIFPHEIKIELVATRGNEVFKKIMTYGEALEVKKKTWWTYKYYQIGFSQYNK